MNYILMRLNKYYDALRADAPFLKSPLNRKIKILNNAVKFFFNSARKPIIISNKPLVAQIEPTSQCNLKCRMCIREKIGVPIGTMAFEDFKIILNKMDSLFKIHLSGQGEAFLNKDLFKMIDYANKRGILVNLNTNATLFTEEIIKKICSVEIGEIAISFESTNKKEYEQIRKGAKFDKVVQGIKNLSSSLKEHKKNTILSLAVTILKDNIDELPKFVEFAHSIGVKKIIAQTMQEKEDYIKNYTSEAKKEIVSRNKENLEKKLNEAKKLAKEKGITFIFDEEKSFGCIWPWRSIYITWNGYITPCCKILNYNSLFIGNIITDNFEEIWNGKAYQMFRKMLKQRTPPAPCKGCNMI